MSYICKILRFKKNPHTASDEPTSIGSKNKSEMPNLCKALRNLEVRNSPFVVSVGNNGMKECRFGQLLSYGSTFCFGLVCNMVFFSFTLYSAPSV